MRVLMDVRPWIDEASAALKAGEHETAARVAGRIIEAGHSSGYELTALADSPRERVLAELAHAASGGAEQLPAKRKWWQVWR